MKVVIFCGGAGMRLRGYADDVPKPMVQIGTRPILWHLMKYYAHFGHKDFILCLGYKGNAIKDYFLHYDESVSNNFVWSQGGKNIQFLNRDIDDWTITFVETGANANVGERLKAVEPYLKGEEMFLANYGDGLSDVPLPARTRCHCRHQLRYHKRFKFEPAVTLSVVERLLAIHIDVKHPIVHPEVILVGNAITRRPDNGLVLPLREARRPIGRRSATNIG